MARTELVYYLQVSSIWKSWRRKSEVPSAIRETIPLSQEHLDALKHPIGEWKNTNPPKIATENQKPGKQDTVELEIPDKLREFINKARRPLPSVTDLDEPLRLDSLAMMELLSFLEAEVGYCVKDDELTLQNFENLRTLGHMLQGKGVKIG